MTVPKTRPSTPNAAVRYGFRMADELLAVAPLIAKHMAANGYDEIEIAQTVDAIQDAHAHLRELMGRMG